jgi:ubiquinone/menaquinone biosynthesis C-methylase UbiE
MTPEPSIANHYSRPRIVETILNAFTRAGKDPAHLTAADLTAVDQFHVGGALATEDLGAQMNLHPGMHLVDIGCGLGGPARFFAAEHRCRVTGVDLTPEFVEAAEHLTRLVGIPAVEFRQTSATSLPFDAATFDGAYLIHVGMNIPDKPSVFREVRRVLKPEGVFAVFDIMRTAEGPIRYPVPWASTEATSFVETPAVYRSALESVGFRVTAERNRADFAIEQTERSIARMQRSGNAGPGLALLMGEKTPILIGNILGMMKEGLLEPVEMIATAI